MIFIFHMLFRLLPEVDIYLLIITNRDFFDYCISFTAQHPPLVKGGREAGNRTRAFSCRFSSSEDTCTNSAILLSLICQEKVTYMTWMTKNLHRLNKVINTRRIRLETRGVLDTFFSSRTTATQVRDVRTGVFHTSWKTWSSFKICEWRGTRLKCPKVSFCPGTFLIVFQHLCAHLVWNQLASYKQCNIT